jgi:hypothetical protein
MIREQKVEECDATKIIRVNVAGNKKNLPQNLDEEIIK